MSEKHDEERQRIFDLENRVSHLEKILHTPTDEDIDEDVYGVPVSTKEADTYLRIKARLADKEWWIQKIKEVLGVKEHSIMNEVLYHIEKLRDSSDRQVEAERQRSMLESQALVRAVRMQDCSGKIQVGIWVKGMKAGTAVMCEQVILVTSKEEAAFRMTLRNVEDPEEIVVECRTRIACLRCGQIPRVAYEDCSAGAEVEGGGTEPHVFGPKPVVEAPEPGAKAEGVGTETQGE